VSAAPVDARRTAFVTGASQGLGQVIAVALAREGFDLVVTGRGTGTLDTTLKAVQALGRRVVPVALEMGPKINGLPSLGEAPIARSNNRARHVPKSEQT